MSLFEPTHAQLSVTGGLALTDPATVVFGDRPDIVVADCAGDWAVGTLTCDAGPWGPRVAALVAIRDGVEVAGDDEAYRAGALLVDTGRALLCPAEHASISELDRAALETPDGQGLGIQPVGDSGVMCPTGLGDGAYDVLVAKGTDGRPARILTVFLYPEQVEELRAVGR